MGLWLREEERSLLWGWKCQDGEWILEPEETCETEQQLGLLKDSMAAADFPINYRFNACTRTGEIQFRYLMLVHQQF